MVCCSRAQSNMVYLLMIIDQFGTLFIHGFERMRNSAQKTHTLFIIYTCIENSYRTTRTSAETIKHKGDRHTDTKQNKKKLRAH